VSTYRPETTTVTDERQLAGLLDHLIDSGIEPAIYTDASGTVGLLYPVGEDVTWHVVTSDPYDHDHGVDGIEFDYDGDGRHIRVDLDKMQPPIVFAALPYPLVVTYQVCEYPGQDYQPFDPAAEDA
jgi:hypothetical protein